MSLLETFKKMVTMTLTKSAIPNRQKKLPSAPDDILITKKTPI